MLDVGFALDADDIVLTGSLTPGGGIRSGFVSQGSSVRFAHHFEPSAVVASILSASLFASDGRAVVTVSSTRGDVNVISSIFEVRCDAAAIGGAGGGTGAGSVSAVPEPRAKVQFVAGLAVVGIATRRLPGEVIAS